MSTVTETEPSQELLTWLMTIAEEYAAESTDRSRGVGCVLVETTGPDLKCFGGFNQFPRGVNTAPPERHERPAKYAYTVHAEIDALAIAARLGLCTDGMLAASTLFPCSQCAGALIQAGIGTLVSRMPDWSEPQWGESFKVTARMLHEAGVRVCLVDAEGTLTPGPMLPCGRFMWESAPDIG